MSNNLEFIDSLTPTQVHFLKKFLIEWCLTDELHYLSQPHCLEYLGPPFKHSPELLDQLPLLRYFFRKFIATFPMITNNPEEDQVAFWRDTVQPFVESFNEKYISDAVERKDQVTKRHQVNVRLLSVLLLYYNSMIITDKEIQYLTEDHLKPSDKGKLDKLSKNPALAKVGIDAFLKPMSLSDYPRMVYVNDIHINIIAVDMIKGEEPEEGETASWSYNPLRLLATKEIAKLHYSFVMQVTVRTKEDLGYLYKSHFTSKVYLEFRRLESKLKKKYPGIMTTEVSRLPHKIRHDDGITDTDNSSSSSTIHTLTTSTRSPKPKFYREKLRLALRGYLNNLSSKPEIAHCDVFSAFLAGPKTFLALSADQTVDYEQRLELERKRLVTQTEFQEETAKTLYHLTQSFEKFKSELVLHPHQLSKQFEEFATSLLIDELSPFLRTFFDWCKLEIAATLYQVFLSQDNSSEWFSKCRKFHKVFPYTVCYGILKYTNPVKIMSRIVDLLLVNMPSVSFPWNTNEKKKVNNLLLMTLVMLLDEDLQDYLKERAKLMESQPLCGPEYAVFIKRIDNYVHSKDPQLTEDIKAEAVENESNLFMTILSSELIEPRLRTCDYEALSGIRQAYEAYLAIEEHKQIETAQTYVSLRQYWQLEVRSRDKELMKQLWKEPELTQLIKKFLTVFYQPLMTVMKKCDIHLVFRDFQRFMDDLMLELAQLDEGDMYFTSSVEMFDRFKRLLDRHESVFWRFMHDLYVKDDQRLFLRLVEWIESFLVTLRTKYTDAESVTLRLAALQPTSAVEPETLIRELDQRIASILDKRRLLKVYLQQTAQVPNNGATNAQEQIDEKWDNMNKGMFEVRGDEFGVSAADVEDYNLMHMHEVATANDEGEKHALLKQIAEIDRRIHNPGGEIAKLGKSAHLQLCSLFAVLPT